MFARYYEAGTARFLATDPAAESITAASPQTWNRYSYSLNNPVRFFDPDGRRFVDKLGQSYAKQVKGDGNDDEKEMVQKADEEEEEISVVESDNAMFVVVDKNGKTVETMEVHGSDAKDALATLEAKHAGTGNEVIPIGGSYTATEKDKSGKVTASTITLFQGTNHVMSGTPEAMAKLTKSTSRDNFVHEATHAVGEKSRQHADFPSGIPGWRGPGHGGE